MILRILRADSIKGFYDLRILYVSNEEAFC